MSGARRWSAQGARAAALTALLTAAAACMPLDTAEVERAPPTPTPRPTPTWTPIPLATATPRPTPTSTAAPAAAPAPPPTQAAEPAPTAAPAPGETPAALPTASPEELRRYTVSELRARLPAPDDLSERLGLPVAQGAADGVTASTFGLQGQFLDPLVIRRPLPLLLALVFVGQSTSSVERLVADDLLAAPQQFLQTVAGGLVEGFQDAARAAEVQELETRDPGDVGQRAAAARTRVASGSDVFEARLLVAEQDAVLTLVLQIARVDEAVDLLDDTALAAEILGSSVARG